MYSLCNKDTLIATFELEDNVSVPSIANLIIYDSKSYYDILGGCPLVQFLSNRKASLHRAHIKSLFQKVSIITLRDFLDASCGLSLNDTLWIKPSDISISWSKDNLYDNKFSDTIAHYALTGLGDVRSELSPEYTTEGALPKCWNRKEDGSVVLFKGSTAGYRYSNSGFEPYAEYYAFQVAKRMDFYPYVQYDLQIMDDTLCSVCSLFTSTDISYVSMSRELLRRTVIDAAYIRLLGENNLDKDYDDLVFFDCIIGNPDRHFGNFGFLRDANNYRVLGLSPIFDNGMGLGTLWTADNYDKDNIFTYVNKSGPVLAPDYNFISFGRSLLNDRRRAAAERLIGWTIPKHPSYNWPEWKYDAMNEFLQKQVKEILK